MNKQQQQPRRSTSPNYYLHLVTTVIKRAVFSQKGSYADQQKSVENPCIDPHKEKQLIFDKDANPVQWQKKKKKFVSTNYIRKKWTSGRQKNEPQFKCHTLYRHECNLRHRYKCNCNFNVSGESVQLL